MNLKKGVLPKLNSRVIIIHSLAAIFIMLAARLLFKLFYVDFYDVLGKSSGEDINEIIEALAEIGYSQGEMFSLYVWEYISTYIGLVVAFLISIKISLKNKRRIWNSISVLILGIGIVEFGFPYVKHIDNVYLILGNLLNSLILSLIINGVLFTIIGLGLFFSKWTKEFVQESTVVKA